MPDTPPTDGSPIENRTPAGAYHAYHDWSSEKPLYDTVLEAFAAVAGADGTSASPMWDSLDVCALDELFRTADEQGPRTTGHLVFVHDGYEIEVHTDGLVRIRPPTVDSGAAESSGPRPGSADSA